MPVEEKEAVDVGLRGGWCHDSLRLVVVGYIRAVMVGGGVESLRS